MNQVSQTQQIPKGIQRLASEYRLGLLQDLYEAKNKIYLYHFIGLVGVAFGGLIIISFFMMYEDIFIWWPRWQAAFVPLLGMAWLGLGVWIMFTSLNSPRSRVFVYPKGLIYAQRKVEIIPWNRIEELWKDIHVNKKAVVRGSYKLRRVDGRTFVFDSDLPRVKMLGDLMEYEITRRLLPESIALYDTGVPRIFGEIMLSGQGITLKQEQKVLPWNEFENLSIDETMVTISKKGVQAAWATVKVALVCNIGVLKGLIDDIKREIARSQLSQILAYRAGVPVNFGQLSISQQGVGIQHGKYLLPWSEIASIGVGENEVIIRRKGESWDWYTLPVAMLPDIPELKDLVHYIMQRQEVRL